MWRESDVSAITPRQREFDTCRSDLAAQRRVELTDDYIDRLDRGVGVEYRDSDTMSQMFEEMGRSVHNGFDRGIDIGIIDGVVETIAQLSARGVERQHDIDRKMSANTTFLFETAMMGIKMHIADTDERHRQKSRKGEELNQKKSLKNIVELAEEAEIVFEIESEVADLIFKHSHTFDAHTESEAGIEFGIDTRGAEDVRVDHTAAENFEPASTLANIAALAATDVARDIHLCRRFGKGEIRRAETYLCLFAEHFLSEIEEGLF